MYFKMAVNNVKKSFKDYAVYFLTLTFAVCIFYSFNSINSQTMMVEMNSLQRDYIDLMNQFMSILSVGVSVILGSLIIYANNFLIKKRKKLFDKKKKQRIWSLYDSWYEKKINVNNIIL